MVLFLIFWALLRRHKGVRTDASLNMCPLFLHFLGTCQVFPRGNVKEEVPAVGLRGPPDMHPLCPPLSILSALTLSFSCQQGSGFHGGVS